MHDPRSTDVVVIGGGQAGLAMSHCLADRSIDHVVLERGEVANSWRTERWDSLRLLTPNWMSRLPGFAYCGDDPDGYMSAAEVATHLETYRRSFDAPVRNGTAVMRITSADDRHVVHTSDGPWTARAVVIATGACSDPHVPELAADLPPHIHQLTPIAYRNPGEIGDDRVLVVGASASGLQIADELARAGREVTLAVGDHVRLPRTYRGMNIHWWMDTVGLLDERFDEVEDLPRARRLPSLQLLGSPEQRTLGIDTVADQGVRVVGRFVGRSGHRGQFSGSLANFCAAADLKQQRLLDQLDDYARIHGLDAELAAPERPRSTVIDPSVLDIDLRSVGTVVWATGFRPRYPWLDATHLDRRGRLIHDGGVLSAPGLYALGLPFLRRRKSSFLDATMVDLADVDSRPDRQLVVGQLALDLDHVVQCEWTRARRELAQQLAFVVVDRRPGPVEHGGQTGVAIVPGVDEQFEPSVETSREVVDAEVTQLRGSQLDRERETIELSAHRGGLLPVDGGCAESRQAGLEEFDGRPVRLER